MVQNIVILHVIASVAKTKKGMRTEKPSWRNSELRANSLPKEPLLIHSPGLFRNLSSKGVDAKRVTVRRVIASASRRASSARRSVCAQIARMGSHTLMLGQGKTI